LKEIDEFSLEEEETLKQMKELKTQGLEDLSHQESEYQFPPYNLSNFSI